MGGRAGARGGAGAGGVAAIQMERAGKRGGTGADAIEPASFFDGLPPGFCSRAGRRLSGNPDGAGHFFHRTTARSQGTVSTLATDLSPSQSGNAHLYMAEPSDHPQPLRFDPGSDQFERAAWPQEFDPLRQHLQEISAMAAMHSPARAPGRRGPRADGGMQGFAGHDRFSRNGNPDARHGMHGHGHVDFFLPWAVDQSIPALVYPIRQRSSPDQPADARNITWLVIELNRTVLEKEVFPELAQKYFRGGTGLDYHVAVREGGRETGQVIYASDSGFGGDPNLQMDGSLNLLGPPFWPRGRYGIRIFAGAGTANAAQPDVAGRAARRGSGTVSSV